MIYHQLDLLAFHISVAFSEICSQLGSHPSFSRVISKSLCNISSMAPVRVFPAHLSNPIANPVLLKRGSALPQATTESAREARKAFFCQSSIHCTATLERSLILTQQPQANYVKKATLASMNMNPIKTPTTISTERYPSPSPLRTLEIDNLYPPLPFSQLTLPSV